MGALIQTKGTQRLANLFNRRFAVLSTTRNWKNNAPLEIKKAFDTSDSLLVVCNKFIAQNAGTSWPADMNDLLYPSATLIVDTISADRKTLTFKLPVAGAIPDAIVAAAGGKLGSAVSCLGKGNAKKIKKNITVVTRAANANVLTVTLTDAVESTLVATTDLVCFSQGKHERLVRRWQWYLDNDLTKQNEKAILKAMDTALSDESFASIQFQTIEDVQQVVVTPTPTLSQDGNDEFTDLMQMNILLKTQSTSAPDKLDTQ